MGQFEDYNKAYLHGVEDMQRQLYDQRMIGWRRGLFCGIAFTIVMFGAALEYMGK